MPLTRAWNNAKYVDAVCTKRHPCMAGTCIASITATLGPVQSLGHHEDLHVSPFCATPVDDPCAIPV